MATAKIPSLAPRPGPKALALERLLDVTVRLEAVGLDVRHVRESLNKPFNPRQLELALTACMLSTAALQQRICQMMVQTLGEE